MSGAVFILGKMWILLASSYSPVSGKVATYVDAMVLPLGCLASMVFIIIFGTIVFDALFTKFILDQESDITTSVLKVSTLGGE